jgi:anaerobic magnesium-protoporphyrin IX monomethyl ester cyclase
MGSTEGEMGDIMKILLIVPTFHYLEYPTPLSLSDFPTGLAYIASSLKKAGYEVHGLNLNNIFGYASGKDMVDGEIKKVLKENHYDLISTGGICTDYLALRDITSCVRNLTTTPIVLGGGIVNNDAEYIFALLKPDYAIVGESELEILNITKLPATGIYRATPIENLDDLPFPDYESFNVKSMLDDFSMATRLLYRYTRTNPRPFVIVTARSCPFHCTFCVHEHGSKYRARSIPNILAEIKENYEKYHFNILLMLDELFAVDKKRMAEFCVELIKAKEQYGWDFDWQFQTHASARFDKATLKLAKLSGCTFFSYGLESASPKVIQSMNKKIKIPEVVEAIQLATEVGIGFGGNLIFGDPVESEETILESLTFWMNYGQDNFIFLASITPYPGSKLFDDCIKNGTITDKLGFYEHINNVQVNMTTLTGDDYFTRLNFFSLLEQSWGMVKSAIDVKYHKETNKDKLTNLYNSDYYVIKGICPHCHKEMVHRQMLSSTNNIFIGTGCPNCNRRIRINIMPEGQENVTK